MSSSLCEDSVCLPLPVKLKFQLNHLALNELFRIKRRGCALRSTPTAVSPDELITGCRWRGGGWLDYPPTLQSCLELNAYREESLKGSWRSFIKTSVLPPKPGGKRHSSFYATEDRGSRMPEPSKSAPKKASKKGGMRTGSRAAASTYTSCGSWSTPPPAIPPRP